MRIFSALITILTSFPSPFPSPRRRARALVRAHGRAGALRAAQDRLDFAGAYGAPGEAAYWEAVMMALME